MDKYGIKIYELSDIIDELKPIEKNIIFSLAVFGPMPRPQIAPNVNKRYRQVHPAIKDLMRYDFVAKYRRVSSRKSPQDQIISFRLTNFGITTAIAMLVGRLLLNKKLALQEIESFCSHHEKFMPRVISFLRLISSFDSAEHGSKGVTELLILELFWEAVNKVPLITNDGTDPVEDKKIYIYIVKGMLERFHLTSLRENAGKMRIPDTHSYSKIALSLLGTDRYFLEAVREVKLDAKKYSKWLDGIAK